MQLRSFSKLSFRAMATWNSRRPNALGTKGAISCDQPLAAHAGLKVLEEGGTAADAAIATAMALAVIQPATCGIGMIWHWNRSFWQ